ncbi:MAG: NADH-quinone oxidoreductase subunit C [Dehalococcoidia bacterium]|nr:NADH-quinone oxidoreductase subunit C [Dehalococcoidia bacterium]
MAGRLRRSLPQAVVAETDEWVEVAPDAIVDVVRWLHDDPDLDAAQLSNLCATDRYDHFEVVYHLQSLDQNHQIVVKARVGEHERASLPSVYPVYKGALLQEREVYDLMGVRFEGHPDLRRMFLWEGYPGFPLRKDFLQITGHHPGLPHFPFEEAGRQER